MRWLKPVKDSIYGLLGQQAGPTDSVMEGGLEEIRETMLSLLGDQGPVRFSALTRRIRYAADIQALWYLRGDLMGALASLHGESDARRKIQAVTQMFQGLLPEAMTSRPSPLMG